MLVRGPSVFKGYWNMREETAAAFDGDWFKTGDIANLDAEGFLFITDRKKDLIKTSGGKFIAPQPIENSLKSNRFIAEAAILGDRRHFPAVVIVPAFAALEDWAAQNGISFQSRRELVADPQVQSLYEGIVEQVNRNLARYERLKKVLVISEELSIEDGTLTPTLKLRRRNVESRYKEKIEKLYADAAPADSAPRRLAAQNPAFVPRNVYNTSMDSLVIAGKSFQSRLIVGTGKYKDGPQTAAALEASGAEVVTVAVRRVNLDRSKESLLDFIDPKKYFLLPNTAGCYTADEAIRVARLGREVGLSDWVKIEVIGDQKTLYPDVAATIEATRVLVKEGFTVLPYTSDDPVVALRLVDAGAAVVMPLGAPIGSGLGIQNTANLRILRELITSVPLIVDAGVGTPSDAALALELGYDAVLMNTGIAAAADPVLMASAMKHAIIAGREGFLAGRMPRKLYASASSPLEGISR